MRKILQTTLAAIALVVGFCGSVQAAGETGAVDKTHEIAPGVFSFVAASSGYHSMFIVNDEGVAAFETVNSKHSAAMVEAIRKVTDKPIRYALQTHNHWDHASGGKVLQDVGAKTVMHKRAAEYLEANPGQDTSPPDLVWEGDLREIELGDITIQMHYLGLNHGLGMTVFVVPEHRVAYIADLVTPNRVMFTIVPDFNLKEWERTLGEILELDFDIAVCSHNDLPIEEAMKGCTKEHVSEQRAFMQDLRQAIFAEFKKGTPPPQIPSAVKLPKYAHWNHYEDWLSMNAQRVLLDIWMGPYPWFPEN